MNAGGEPWAKEVLFPNLLPLPNKQFTFHKEILPKISNRQSYFHFIDWQKLKVAVRIGTVISPVNNK